jgi:penicillin amidase
VKSSPKNNNRWFAGRPLRRWFAAAAVLFGWGLVTATLPQRDAQREAALREQARGALAQTSGELRIPGLEQPVEVLRDEWGVPHIYAQAQADLFFAQGFVAAQDRLWQLDLWRRQAEGRLAEVLGPAALERDRMARLLRFRGNWDAEWRSYSPDARAITESFVRGINAYIAHIGDRLPVEFQLLGIRPEPWTPEVCVSRMAAYPMTGNAEDEILRAEVVARLGPQRAALLFPTDPQRKIEPPPGLELEGIDATVLSGLRAAQAGVRFPGSEGSNNWAVHGARTKSGKPILANDPHRALQLPSLRYLVHLVGPGWNVIGAGEPALPAVSIGHNERIAFGLTIFAADQQDLYVERTHEKDPAQYFDAVEQRGWRKMQIIEEEIQVRGEAQPRKVQLKYTRHGPVIHEDPARQRAYALRWIGSEPGTAGYFAGMALSRATNWKEFRRALERWKLPPENFVYADVDGNIGYQAAALAPIRRAWLGILPVPGDTVEYEWDGFFPLSELPNEYNPSRKFVSTANNNTLRRSESRAIGFDWSTSHRADRIRQVLSAESEHTVEASQRLQTDHVSLAAQQFVSLLGQAPPAGDKRIRALKLLRDWEARLSPNSPSAAIYSVWMDKLRERVFRPHLPDHLWNRAGRSIDVTTLFWALTARRNNPVCDEKCRQTAPGDALDEAIVELERRLGADMDRWRWGALRQAEFRHALANDPERAAVLNRGPVERGGDGTTLNAASGPNYRQTAGASFRQIIDLFDWDKSVASNVPGQSGQPESPFYDNLLPLWARDQYFPLLYSRPAVEKHTKSRLTLLP